LELLIGCGSNRIKRLSYANNREWRELITMDMNDDHKPDLVWDIAEMPFPFSDDTFDEIHAYDVLEHVGSQGDWRFFFRQWMEFYRLLKPGGIFFGICPSPVSPWAWGDPGHTRILTPVSLTYLIQPEYTKQVGKSAMTDYRFVFPGDFDVEHSEIDGEQFVFTLRAVKPSRMTR
jgi:SAM-dependent methyltransferase